MKVTIELPDTVALVPFLKQLSSLGLQILKPTSQEDSKNVHLRIHYTRVGDVAEAKITVDTTSGDTNEQ